MGGLRLGLLLWSHATDWPAMLAAARQADQLGYAHAWVPDHLLATVGDPYQPILEGWTIAAAWAALLEHARIGVLVSANTFRHPAVVAKMVTTIDHISNGRAILGLGAGWFAREHAVHGIPFGDSAGERLGWLDDAAAIARGLLDGQTVTVHGDRYRLDQARHAPPPVQSRLPLMIGGGGERRTLRTVAAYADLWNVTANPEVVARKNAVLDQHCAALGRDPADITRTVTIKLVIRDTVADARRVWADQLAANGMRREDYPDVLLGPPAAIARTLRRYQELGVSAVIVDAPAPYDGETIERLATEVPLRLAEDHRPERARAGTGAR